MYVLVSFLICKSVLRFVYVTIVHLLLVVAWHLARIHLLNSLVGLNFQKLLHFSRQVKIFCDLNVKMSQTLDLLLLDGPV